MQLVTYKEASLENKHIQIQGLSTEISSTWDVRNRGEIIKVQPEEDQLCDWDQQTREKENDRNKQDQNLLFGSQQIKVPVHVIYSCMQLTLVQTPVLMVPENYQEWSPLSPTRWDSSPIQVIQRGNIRDRKIRGYLVTHIL